MVKEASWEKTPDISPCWGHAVGWVCASPIEHGNIPHKYLMEGTKCQDHVY